MRTLATGESHQDRHHRQERGAVGAARNGEIAGAILTPNLEDSSLPGVRPTAQGDVPFKRREPQEAPVRAELALSSCRIAPPAAHDHEREIGHYGSTKCGRSNEY